MGAGEHRDESAASEETAGEGPLEREDPETEAGLGEVGAPPSLAVIAGDRQAAGVGDDPELAAPEAPSGAPEVETRPEPDSDSTGPTASEPPPAEPSDAEAHPAEAAGAPDEGGEGDLAPPAGEPSSPHGLSGWSEPPPGPERERLARHHVAPAQIQLSRLDLDDDTFKLRDEGDLSLLATDLARLGQLAPVDLRLRPPDRFQVVCGFRRVAALRFLQRDRVLARLHTELSDEDALLMALSAAIDTLPVDREDLEAARERLEGEGRLSAAARDMLEKALADDDGLAPEEVEGEEEEVDADELATQVTARLSEVNQDLSLLADVFGSLDEERRRELLEQLRYSSDLVTYLERK